MKNEAVQTQKTQSKYIPTSDFYSQIIDSLQDYAIITLDKDLIINSWSSGSVKIFGYETDEVIGRHISLIFSEEDNQKDVPRLEMETTLREGRAVDNRWHICKGGSKFFAYGLAFPLSGIDGELLGFVKILRDLTERKRAEEAIKSYVKELEELNTHKENIFAILSHDLRGPLGVVIMAAEYLKLNYDNMDDKEVKVMIELIHKSSKSELDMLDYLVEWASVKYASEAFSPHEIKLEQYVKKVFETFRELAESKSINLVNVVNENTTVYADEKMLVSIIQNLISNAIKFTKSGTIAVSASENEEKVVVRISDTGVGMSNDEIEKLFTPQLKKIAKTRQDNKGVGLGLLLVKGFLEKNGGEIWVESKEGEGSTFYFSLPIHKPAEKIENIENLVS